MKLTIEEWIIKNTKIYMPYHLSKDNISLQTTIEETGWDGADLEDFIVAIKFQYNVRVSFIEAGNWKTLQSIHNFIQEKLNEKLNS